MYIITNKAKSTRTFTFCGEKIALSVGANGVSDPWAAAAQKDDYFRACVKKGFFQVRPVPAEVEELTADPGDVFSDLRLLKVVEALKAVEQCDDVAVLRQWLDQDERKRVKQAILDRGVALLPTGADATKADDVVGGDATDE